MKDKKFNKINQNQKGRTVNTKALRRTRFIYALFFYQTVCPKSYMVGRPKLLRGFFCAYHPVTLGSNPMHTISLFQFVGIIENKI